MKNSTFLFRVAITLVTPSFVFLVLAGASELTKAMGEAAVWSSIGGLVCDTVEKECSR